LETLKSMRKTLIFITSFYFIINAVLICMIDDYEFDIANVILIIGTLFFLVALLLVHKLIHRYERIEKEIIDRDRP
jgi:multisubunit Na+/H+ antiporter MnhG subunit